MASTPLTFTSASSTAIDLSRLPAPDVIEALDFEAIYTRRRADFLARYPEFTAFVESDPAIKLLETGAYAELVLRQRINDAARSLLVAYALGSNLDHLAAVFGVVRQEITPADPVTGAAAVMESDEDLRRRVLLAPDSYSVAGPASAYVFHALSADADVLDASAISPRPGEVTVSVLSRSGDGTASPELVATVRALLAGDEVRPLTDRVTVQSAELVAFDVMAQLTLYPGPDAQLILATATTALEQLLAANRRLGRNISRSAMVAALHVGGVQNVNLVEPVADVLIEQTQVPAAGTIDVTIAGFDE
ncbi:MAG: baseplate J/gp47 family protein [Erythrobacter sp.]|uniref:baseplate assembly protein n=1 Tax=Erythrobacter sp. TaxID=1042 RepID=UPI0025F301DE|nr:baseplate J/gp47 family protein [Erythrobacter sp.]MCM0001022.1 baseplate J/gp47 family protein [Erythrobacter sp.]